MATRPADPARLGVEPLVVVHHAGMRFVPDGMTLWVPHPDHGTLVYQGGQLLPEAVLDALKAGAVMVPGPPGVLVLEVSKGGNL